MGDLWCAESLEIPEQRPLGWSLFLGSLTRDPTGWQLCALTQNSQEGYNPHPALHRVREQEASRGKDLLILLLDVAGDLLENLQGEGPVEDEGAAGGLWGRAHRAVRKGATFS